MKKNWLIASMAIFSSVPLLAANYGDRPEAVKMMNELADRDGYDKMYLRSLLLAVGRDDSVLEKISRPAEKTKPWYEYRKIFEDQERTDNGVIFWRNNAEALQRAEAQYGVDPAIIVAILGVETRYGKVTGNTPVFATLLTLCLDYPARAPFFCEQTDYFLRLAKRENRNPLSVKGSYAGAMGMAQFMPSSYYNDAVDFDGDGKVDLWHSPTDAIGSIAHYLQVRGWQKNGRYKYQLPSMPSNGNFGKDHKPSFKISELLLDEQLKNNVNLIKEIGNNTDEMVGSLVVDSSEHEKAWWISYNNFYVITRYNASPLYAMAVVDLADRIRQKRESELKQ
ncbi:MAG: lytic murein transglycosylase B [Cardiobacteriaceae bacterium]|nr:lytic murein transglycosylase B [Cardiobacteriaceae bacterium]